MRFTKVYLELWPLWMISWSMERQRRNTTIISGGRWKGLEKKECALILRKKVCILVVCYFGHHLSKDQTGLSQVGVCKRCPLRIVLNLKQFLAWYYLSKFAPSLSDVSAPLRPLLRHDHEFVRDKLAAFQKIKASLPGSQDLSWHSLTWAKTSHCKWMPPKYGLGAVLLREVKPLAYASKSLTDIQIEIERAPGYPLGFYQTIEL